MKKLFFHMMAVAIAAMTFTACEDVPEPYPIPTPEPEKEIVYTGNGTLESPYTCEDAIRYVQALNGEESDVEVYVKGIVAAVTEEFTTNYGNGTFTISDDGTATNEFTAYRVLYLGNKKYTSGKPQIKQGDEVIVYGKVVNYRGNTPETVQGSAFLYSLNGETEGGGNDTPGNATGSGTLADPYNAVAAKAYAESVGDTESDKEVYIKGKVADITEQYGTQYGNATFTISDDGTSSNTFTVYRALYLGNKKYASGDLLKQGDDVIVCGKVTNFKGNTPETVTGKAYLYSLNGKTEGGENPNPNPNPGEGTGSGTLADPYNAVAAAAVATALGAGNTSSESYYIKGKISTIKYQFDADHGTATFFISDDGKAENEFQVYSAYYLENKSWQDGYKQIATGDEVIIYGQLTNYNGTPETASKKAYIYSLNGETKAEASGENQGGENQGGGGEVSGNTITVVYGDLDISSLDNPVKLADGTTLTFSQEDGKNPPIYHASTKIIRMYAHNAVTINAGSKTITSVAFAYDTYQGTAYKGNDEMYGEAGSSKITPTKDDKNVTFTGVNNSTLKVVNDFSSNSGGTQFRCTGVVITYAE